MVWSFEAKKVTKLSTCEEVQLKKLILKVSRKKKISRLRDGLALILIEDLDMDPST